MNSRLIICSSLVAVAVAMTGQAADTPHFGLTTIREVITTEEVRTDIAELSSDEMGGRFFRSPFAEKAAKWIQAKFEAIGLKPAGTDDSFRQAIDKSPESGPNLIAAFPMPKKAMTDGVEESFIIISAHYDHLRPKRTGDDKIYNGADDNASGVAGMLAVARAVMACEKVGGGAQCTILFIAFNGEEAGLLGSSAFVKSPTVPLSKVRAVFNMDMISRGPAREIFIDGGPIGEPVVAALKKANESIGLKLRVNEHPDWLDRSDQGPFLRKKVPAVLFSVEDHEDYHRVTDEVSKVDAGLAAEVAQLVALAAIEMSREPFTARSAAPVPTTPAKPLDAAPKPAPADPPPAL